MPPRRSRMRSESTRFADQTVFSVPERETVLPMPIGRRFQRPELFGYCERRRVSGFASPAAKIRCAGVFPFFPLPPFLGFSLFECKRVLTSFWPSA